MVVALILCCALGGACSGPQDPAARLVEQLGDERVWCLDGDEVVAPAALPQLVALGAAAVPALLEATAGDDDWVRLRAVDALGRIGEARALPTLEALFVRDDFELRCRIVEALARIGGEPAIARVRRVFATLVLAPPSMANWRALIQDGPKGKFDRLIACAVLWRLRQHGGVPMLLALAEDGAWEAVEFLAKVEAVRDALGMGPAPEELGMEAFDDELFVPAVREWYSEQVLHEPSPWRAGDAYFSRPHADIKHRAIAVLRRELLAHGAATFRVLTHDVPGDGGPPPASGMSLSMWRHGRGVDIDWWRRSYSCVLWCWITASPIDDAGTVGGVAWRFSCRRVVMSHVQLQRWWVGVQAVRAAQVRRWWGGPDGSGSASTTHSASARGLMRPAPTSEVHVVVHTEDRDGPATLSFSQRFDSVDLERLAPLLAVVAMRPEVVTAATPAAAIDVRQEFREHVMLSPAFWASGSCWDWARPRLIGIAAAFGDVRLLPVFAGFLDYPEEPSNDATRVAVCDALAAMTRRELRFDPDGQPRTLDALVHAWRDWLLRR